MSTPIPVPIEPQPGSGPPAERPPFPHDFPDRAFKELMSDLRNLQDLTEVVAPQYAHCLDCLNAVIVPPEIIVSEVPDWPKGISDIIYDVPIRSQSQGAATFPLAVQVVEHQSMPAEDVIFRAFWIHAAKWKLRMQHWDRNQRPGPFRLNSGTGIIIYTGAGPWSGPKSLSDLIDAPESLVEESPKWAPKILEIRQRSADELLRMDQRFFQSLAVVRGQNEPRPVFTAIFQDTMKALESLRKGDHGRWIGLMRFVMSWGFAKRDPGERADLLSATRKVYRSRQAQAEVEQMSNTIIGVEFQRGVEQGWTQGEAKGEIRGQLLGQRKLLTRLLSKKFPANIDESVIQRIEAADNPNLLEQWAVAAGLAKSWKQFLKAADWPPSP